MMVSKRNLLFKGSIFRCHVNFGFPVGVSPVGESCCWRWLAHAVPLARKNVLGSWWPLLVIDGVIIPL